MFTFHCLGHAISLSSPVPLAVLAKLNEHSGLLYYTVGTFAEYW